MTSPRPHPAPGADTALGALDAIVGYHLRRASAVFAADFARVLGATGMRPVLFGILSVIGANPGISQGMAGQALGILRPNMVSLINDLVERGWIDRETAAEDRRAFALFLTPAGEAMIATAADAIQASEDRLLAELNDDERRQLIELLLRIERREG